MFHVGRAEAQRQQPAQGLVGRVLTLPSMLPTMAMASNSRSPALTAAARAARSAQMVGEKEAFSILQPVNTLPDRVSSAAPTLKWE